MDREDPRVKEYIKKCWAEEPGMSYGRLAKRLNANFPLGQPFTRDGFKNWARRRGLKADSPAPEPKDEIAAAKEELVSRAKHAAERQDTRRKAAVELLIDAFREIAPQMPPLPKVVVPALHPGPYPKEEAILSLGDLHSSETLDAEETGGLGSFDWDTMMVYACRLIQKVRAIVPRHNYPISTLNLHELGDMLTGLGIYPGQWNYAAYEEVEQVLRCAEFLAWLLVELAKTFRRIKCKCVYGNHGRVGNKGERRLYTNWDYLVYKLVEQRIAADPDLKDRITFEIPKTWWLLTEIMGWRYLLMHGDDIRGWMGLPYYGLARHTRNWSMLLERFGATDRLKDLARRVGPFDEMEIGHHHRVAYINDTGVRLWINGAWPGGSLLSLKRMGTASVPAQLFRGVSEASSTSWLYDLTLDTPLAEEALPIEKAVRDR